MYKKLLFSILIILSIVFSLNTCFANDLMQDAVNGVRDAVGGAENAVEGAVKNITDASKNATGNMENTANDIMNNTINETTRNSATTKSNTDNNSDNGYVAKRTSSDSTFMGMGATAWTWLILGVVAIAIVSLVWFYSTQLSTTEQHNNKND